MSSTLTRINNNQITDAISGNVYFGINANTKIQPYSITSTLLANNLTYGSDLTITGNLSVSGNVTAIDTTNVTIEDPLLLLASNQTGSPTLDIGYIGQRGTSNNIAFVWDESLSSFVTVFTDSGATDNTNINILSYANLITGSANVTGDLIAGNLSLNGNVTSNLNVTGDVVAGNILTIGVVSSTGTITGGNLLTAGLISATGNITTANLISATGNIYTAGYFIGTFAGNISGNLTVPGANTEVLYNNSGNAGASTGFTFNQASNVMFVGGNILSNASISASGNVTANNFFGNLSGKLSSDLDTNGYLIKGGNYSGITLAMPVGAGANLSSSYEGGVTLAAGTSGNTAGTLVLDQTGNVAISGNVSTVGNIATAGKISATGNITGEYYFGNGSQLTGISTTAGTALTNGNTNITTALNGNANVTINGTNNVVVWTTTGEYVTGDVSASGNIIGGNVTTSGILSSVGNIAGGNVLTAGAVSATGNVTGGNIVTAGFVSATGNLQTTGNLSVAGNATIVGNLNVQGNITFIDSNVITTDDLYVILANNQTTYANINNAGLAVGPAGSPLTYWQYQNSSNSWSTNVAISATANVIGGNLVTSGLVTATGNVTGGNILTVGYISSTGNLISGNINTANVISATGNIYTAGYFIGTFAGNISGNLTVPGANTEVLYNNSGNAGASSGFTFNQATNVMTVSGNTSSGNVLTTGLVSATGNVTSGNVLTAGIVSATGNVYGNNFITSGSGGNISGANVISGNTISAITVSATGNIYSDNLIVTTASATGNITGGNIFTSGQVSAIGNITANTGSYLIGDGAYISNINAANVSTAKISNGGSYANVTSLNGNVVIAVGTSSNIVATFYDQGVNISTNVSVTGNIIPGSSILAPTDNSINIGNSNAAFSTTYTYGISTINAANARVTVNPSLYYTNFAVNGSTANVLYIDSNTNTVEIGNSQVTVGATLAINASDSILLPSGNISQRPSSPVVGMLRWNTSLSYLEIWNGSAWSEVGGTAFTVIQNEQFNGDGTTTVFNLASSQTTDSCIVTINGIVQIPTTAYSVSGIYPSCVLTFTEAPVTGDTIDVREITTTTSVHSISNSSANAVVAVTDSNANVNITGSLVVGAGAGYIYGDGTYITNVGGGNIVATRIQSGNSQVNIASPGGNIYMAVGNANVVSISSAQTTIYGNLNPNSNATQSLGNSTNQWSNLWISGNTIFIGGSNISANATTLSFGGAPIVTQNANGNISSGNINITGSTASANRTSGALIVTGGVGVSGDMNVGTSITVDGGSYGNVVTTQFASVFASGSGPNPRSIMQVRGADGVAGIGIQAYSGINGQIYANTGITFTTGATLRDKDYPTGGTNRATFDANGLAVTGIVSATGNITSSNLSVGTGTVTVGNIVNSNSNAVGNIGTSSNYFNTVFAKATSALYADLAELYLADAEYAPGTVVSFGGDFEVTGSVADGDARVAGIVSTNPSYLMNSGLTGENVVAVGLQGRVPCSVTGIVRKGDMLVSNGDGSARAETNPAVGTVIGKALANFDGEIGVIEVVVGIR